MGVLDRAVGARLADGGAGALGVLAVVLMLAPALAAPFTSILGDRFDRVIVMLSADLVRVALMAAAALIAFADAPLPLLYALAALSSMTSTAFRPAQAAILPSLARTPDELTAANVASSTIESVTSFAGPALGGVRARGDRAGRLVRDRRGDVPLVGAARRPESGSRRR